MRQTVLDAFGRYRLYVLGVVGVIVVAVVTAVVFSTTGDDGGRTVPPTRTPDTPLPTSTAAATASPSPTSTIAIIAPTDVPLATSTPRPTRIAPSPTETPHATSSPTATATLMPGQTPSPEPLSITILSPMQGENVGPTFLIEVAVTGIELELGPGGQLIPGAGHWHIALDTAPPLPELHADGIVQFGPVEPGLHTITVLLNLNDADLTVVAIDQVQITVTD